MNSFKASTYLGSFMCPSISLQTSLKSLLLEYFFMLIKNVNRYINFSLTELLRFIYETNTGLMSKVQKFRLKGDK